MWLALHQQVAGRSDAGAAGWPSQDSMNSKAEFIRKLKSLKIRIYYEKKGVIYNAVFSGKSEIEILLKLQEKGISTKDIRRVEEA